MKRGKNRKLEKRDKEGNPTLSANLHEEMEQAEGGLRRGHPEVQVHGPQAHVPKQAQREKQRRKIRKWKPESK